MIKYNKHIAHLSAAELTAEAQKLRDQIRTAHLDKIAGKAKNLRLAFILRKQLATVLAKSK